MVQDHSSCLADAGRILIVDDMPPIRKLLRCVLEDAGHHVMEAGSVDDALHQLRSYRYDMILTDIQMPGRSGLELARLVTRDFPETKVMVMSGVEKQYLRDVTRELDLQAVLTKPLTPDVLVGAVAAVMERDSRAA